MKRDAVPASKWLRVFMMMLYPLSVLLALILCNVAPPSKKSILDCDWDYVLFLTASSTLIEAVLSSWKTVKKAEENAETTESEPKETKLIDTKNATTISEGQISEDSGTKVCIKVCPIIDVLCADNLKRQLPQQRPERRRN